MLVPTETNGSLSATLILNACSSRHEPNVPSGGRITDLEIGEFLARGAHSPEHLALLQLVRTLASREDSDR